ncbi:transposable element Tc3 transposase [Trichonephila clavipes]|nr:transposable element Tc3 transposase [Trichonephila clavipes]
MVYADKPQTLDHLEDNIRRVIADIRPQMLEKVIENWTSRLDYIRASRGSLMLEIPFKIISGKEIARRIAVKITPSCCLSEKWRIINLLDDICMLLPEVESLEVGGRPQCDKWGCRVRNCSQHRFTTLETISIYRNSYPGFSSGCPRGTTPADDRYIVLQTRRNRRQTAGEIARHTTQATGRPISRFTVARRLHGGGLFARRPVRCVSLTLAHRRRRSLWCREHQNWRDNEWGRVIFTDESRFSLSSDSHRILIWRERGSRNHPSNIIEKDRGAMGLQFLFMDDNAPCHRTVAAEQLLESRRLAAPTLPPVTIWELRLALQDEWAAMPQRLIDTLILSMGRHCETCLAVRGDHIPY